MKLTNALMFAFLVALTTAEAETHRFTPTSYFNTFSFAHPPVDYVCIYETNLIS